MRQRRVSFGVFFTLTTLIALSPSLQADIYFNHAWSQNEGRLNITECGTDLSRNGLNCEKEGFFIQGFTDHALWLGSSGGSTRIPASDSICCRPSVPDMGALDLDMHPVSVVSVGCHFAASDIASHMSCETSGSSFVSGFVGSFPPEEADGLMVPDKGVFCCTPVLLMSTGDVWKLTPCNCTDTNADHPEVNCPVGQLLKGFSSSVSVKQRSVPVPPTHCCDLCLGDVLYDTTQCKHLQSCNGNGVCIMGSCECYPDWVGEGCAKRKEDYFADPTFESSVWWLGGLGFIGAFFCLFATFYIIRRTEQDGPRPPNDRGLLGLISSYINDAGSAGSADTESLHSEGPEDDMELAQSAQEPKSGCTEEQEPYQPLLQMFCCLCESRDVQVTLVPCGHSNLCRKCSRKLSSCPFCRKPIVRRQRLFLSV